MSHTTAVEVELLPASQFSGLPGTTARKAEPTEDIVSAELGVQTEGLSKKRASVIILAVTCVVGIADLLNGLVSVSIARMASDLRLSSGLLLWPASIYALTCGCSLLLFGSIADVVGSRRVYLFGCLLQSAFALACGFARSGTMLLVFRAFGGIAGACCLPTAVSIITSSFPPGKRRNIAFACLGGGQPTGFCIGLVFGGVFTDTIGWRWGFYTCAILNTVILVMSLWGLPKSIDGDGPVTFQRLRDEIDWIGLILASCLLSFLSYSFASIAGSTEHAKQPLIIALLACSGILIPSFILWVSRQERLSRPALIPNSLWRNKAFSAICINVFIIWGTFNSLESLLALFFQYVQKLDAVESSIRFLPSPIVGVVAEFAVGMVVHRVRGDVTVFLACAIASIAPLLAALMNPADSYWKSAFPPLMITSIGIDAIFTIANLIITSSFPNKTQALAGGVFNTVAMVGKSLGLGLSSVIANSVTNQAHFADKESPEALFKGYQASWWWCFALTLSTVLVTLWGLRDVGKVGLKRD